MGGLTRLYPNSIDDHIYINVKPGDTTQEAIRRYMSNRLRRMYFVDGLTRKIRCMTIQKYWKLNLYGTAIFSCIAVNGYVLQYEHTHHQFSFRRY